MLPRSRVSAGCLLSVSDWYREKNVSANKKNALVLTEPIKSRWWASFKRRTGKFASNPSILDYLRMPVAKEKPRLCRT
jgi:hypothetical protein